MFEIENMNEVFDYSLVDSETADFLKEREYAINGITEDARIKIGRELKKAQNRLAHNHNGIFEKWYTSGGLKKSEVYYAINLYDLSKNLEGERRDTFLNAPKSLQVEAMKRNAPEELKEQVFNGDITTYKEYKALLNEKRQLEKQYQQMEMQLKQARNSEAIAIEQLEHEQDKEPNIIERYTEPEDYTELSNRYKTLEDENKRLKQQAQSDKSVHDVETMSDMQTQADVTNIVSSMLYNVIVVLENDNINFTVDAGIDSLIQRINEIVEGK